MCVCCKDESELLEALAAVLHICDVTFVSSEDENTDSSEPGGTRISSPTHIETIAELLQVESDDLVSCLTTETIYTRGKRRRLDVCPHEPELIQQFHATPWNTCVEHTAANVS